MLSTGSREPPCFIETWSTILAVNNASVIFVVLLRNIEVIKCKERVLLLLCELCSQYFNSVTGFRPSKLTLSYRTLRAVIVEEQDGGVETLGLAPHKLELHIKFREYVAMTSIAVNPTRTFRFLDIVFALNNLSVMLVVPSFK